MIEIIENAIQLIATGICTAIAVRKGVLLRSRVWIILALTSGVFFLGDLYWELFLLFYGRTPVYSYIPYLSWYASYLFLLLLLYELRDVTDSRRHRKVLWFVPLFTVGMCIFYLQWGDWIGNIIATVLMSFLLWRVGNGLLSLRDQRKKHPEMDCGKAWIFATALLFCLAEYGAWTASCFGIYDTWISPYYWFDSLLSAVFLLLPWTLGKSVGR